MERLVGRDADQIVVAPGRGPANNSMPLDSLYASLEKPRTPRGLPPFGLFISHYTKDDSHDAFKEVKAFMTAKDITVFNPTTHLSHVKVINKEAMQGAVKRSTLVIAALSDGFFESTWCAAEIAAAKEAGIKVIPCYSGDDHGAKQIDNWVLTARRKNRSGDRVVS